MQTIKIYRKESALSRPKFTRADVERFNRKAELGMMRVQRPSLQSFFIPAKAGAVSDFYKLPALSPGVIKNRGERILDHASAGWEIPLDSLGRGKEVTPSTAQSILLWIKKNLGEFVNPDDVSIVIE